MNTKFFTLFVVLLCIAQVFAEDFEKDGIYYNFLGGDSVAVTHKGGSYSPYLDSVIIPAIVENNNTIYRITAIGDSAFLNCSMLNAITIPNSVTSIGNLAFYNCSNLTEITIPDAVTTIGTYAFINCEKLISITLPKSIVEIGQAAFQHCSSLKNVFYMGTIESWCKIKFVPGIEHYAYGEWLPYIAQYYSNPISLSKQICINNKKIENQLVLNVDSVYDGVFYGLSSLKSVTLTKDVAYLGKGAFAKCDNLTSITSSANLQSIKFMVFYQCSQLKNGINKLLENINAIDNYAFTDCKSFSDSLFIPNTVNKIGSYAFSGCTELPAVKIGEEVTLIGESAFENCSNINAIVIPNKVDSIGANAFKNTSLKTLIVGEGVTSIGDKAFNSNSPFESVIWNAKRCKDLGTPEFPPVDGDGGPLAWNITDTTSFSFGEKVEHIPSCLCFNTGIPTLNIPNSVTSIGPMAFRGCTNLGLTDITATAKKYSEPFTGSFGRFVKYDELGRQTFEFDNLKRYIRIYTSKDSSNKDYLISPMFDLTDALDAQVSYEQANLKGTQTDWKKSCKLLISTDYTNDATTAHWEELEGMSWGAKQGEFALSTIKIPEKYIGQDNIHIAFYYAVCAQDTLVQWRIKNFALTMTPNASAKAYNTPVVIPNSVKQIGYSAFARCSNLTSCSIGNNIDSIRTLFTDCYNLTCVISNNTTPPISNDAFRGISSEATLLVPCGVTELYKNAENWQSFSVIKEELLYDITIATNNEKFGKVAILQQPHCTQPAIFQAIPESGCKFVSWNDGNTENPRTVDVIADVEYIATFTDSDVTAVGNIVIEHLSGVQKVFENGTIYILRNGEKYTIDGRKVE